MLASVGISKNLVGDNCCFEKTCWHIFVVSKFLLAIVAVLKSIVWAYCCFENCCWCLLSVRHCCPVACVSKHRIDDWVDLYFFSSAHVALSTTSSLSTASCWPQCTETTCLFSSRQQVSLMRATCCCDTLGEGYVVNYPYYAGCRRGE